MAAEGLLPLLLEAGRQFGVNKGSPENSSSTSGYADLPPYLQNLYQLYAQQYQDAAGSGGFMRPGLNPEQEGAYQGLAHPDYSDEGLADYRNAIEPLRQNLAGLIQERGKYNEGDLLRRFGHGGGYRGSMSSDVGNLISQNQRQTSEQLNNLDVQSLYQALGLRDQALGRQLEYGNAQQGINEDNSPYGQLLRMIQGLQGVPNSTSSQMQAAKPDRYNTVGKLSSIFATGGAASGYGGGGSPYGGYNQTGLPGNFR